MYFNHKTNSLLYCAHRLSNTSFFRLIMIFTDESTYTLIPLSSFIIFLVLLINCAVKKRGKSTDEETETENNYDIKDEYMLLCFPCLKKKPDFRDIESASLDLNDQFEYIVEKYAIRKVPLVLANTTEDLMQIQKEMEINKAFTEGLPGGDYRHPKSDQNVYSVQEIVPCLPVAHQTGSMHSRRERPANEVLDSSVDVSRESSRRVNYDQVPKDPERMPKLGRPYTSAIKHLPISEVSSSSSKHIPKQKSSNRAVYNVQASTSKQMDVQRPSTSGGTTSKTAFVVTENEREKQMEGIFTPFKTQIRPHSSGSEVDISNKPFGLVSFTHKQEIKSKMITYEDIQSLDVGYEFTNDEKLGVKPKMIRIRGNYEPDRLSLKPHDSNFSSRTFDIKSPPKRFYTDAKSPEFRRKFSKPVYNETSFIPPPSKQSPRLSRQSPPKSEKQEEEDEDDDEFSCKICQLENQPEAKPAKPQSPSRTSPRFFVEAKEDPTDGKEELTQALGLTKSNSFSDFSYKTSYKTSDATTSAPYAVHAFEKKMSSSLEEPETDTTGSLYSRESKTSSMATSPRSSEQDVDKKQTLKWKIIIKHHKDSESSKDRIASTTTNRSASNDRDRSASNDRSSS